MIYLIVKRKAIWVNEGVGQRVRVAIFALALRSVCVSSKRRVSSSTMLILGAAISADVLSAAALWTEDLAARLLINLFLHRGTRSEVEWQEQRQTRERRGRKGEEEKEKERETRSCRDRGDEEKWRRGWRDSRPRGELKDMEGVGKNKSSWRTARPSSLSPSLPVFLFFRFWDVQTPCQDPARRQAHLIYSQSPSILTEVW